MEENWVRIYSSNQPYKAEMVVHALAENEIQAVAINKKDSSYLVGEDEVYVNSEDQKASIEIIKTLNLE